MRLALAVLYVLLAAALGSAVEPAPRAEARRGVRTDLFIEIPLEYSTDVIFPFGGSHHTVPGTVTINRAPYYCVKHAQAFRARPDFVEHLRTVHGLTDDEIPAAVLVDRGQQVRYLGD